MAFLYVKFARYSPIRDCNLRSRSKLVDTKSNPSWGLKFQKETEKPVYWVFQQQPNGYCNKPWHKILLHYLNLNLNPVVLDLDPTKMPDKPLGKHGNTSIKG